MRRNILLSISLLVLLALVAGCKKNELDRSVEVLKPVPFDSVVSKYQKAEAGTLKFVALNQTEILPDDFSDPEKAQIGISNLEKKLGTSYSKTGQFAISVSAGIKQKTYCGASTMANWTVSKQI